MSWVRAGSNAEGVVLVLHGGREVGLTTTRPWQLAALRMVPIARAIASPRGPGRGRLAVARLRYAVRGWNGDNASPIADAEWALDLITQRYPGLPIGLAGHSMGGRTALRVAGHPRVRSVAALAPWLPRDEPIGQLTGRSILIVHGSADRMTSPRASAAVTAQLRDSGIEASFVEVTGERHAMLKQPRLWKDLTAGFMSVTLLPQSEQTHTPNLLRRVIDGEARITV